MTPVGDSARPWWWREAGAVLAGAFLFNLGQGVLRPTMPLYLRQVFSANYRMVTAIPAVFGAGKWLATLPTGALLDRLGRRPLMVCGLLVVASSDVASAMTRAYAAFLGLRALAGAGWAMFGTVATTAMVNLPAEERRGRAVSVLLMSETSGLLVGAAAGGWMYERLGLASPLVFEAACMLVAAGVVARWALPAAARGRVPGTPGGWRRLGQVLRMPGVLVMGATSAALTVVQTGVLVFLFPLYLVTRGGLGPGAVGLLTSLGVLGRLLALWFGGSASDRWGRLRVLVPGLLVYATLLAGIPLLTRPIALGLASLALGAAAGCVAALPTALVGDRVPPPAAGLGIGWLRTMTDTGQVLGPLAMGACADAAGLSAPFLVGAAMLLAVAGWCGAHARAASVPPVTGIGGAA